MDKKQILIIIATILILAGFGFAGEGEENTKNNSYLEIINSNPYTQDNNSEKPPHRSLNTDYVKVVVTYTSNAAPTVSNVKLNADTSFSPVESTIKSVNVTGQVIDSDGATDCTTISAIAYRSGVSSTCTANDNYCYRGISCNTSVSGSTISCTCPVSIWFHADPTDAGDYSAQYWQGAVLATDSVSNTVLGASTNTTVDLNTLLALDVTTSIAYGSLSPGADTGATNQNVTVTATGNAAIDCSLKGANMTSASSGGTVLATKQKYGLSTFTYSSGGTQLSTSDASLELVCAKPSTHPSDSTDIIYWGLGVDNGTPAAADYSGTNTLTATPD